MRALIYQTSTKHAALWDVAGKPLVVRQLQWLRDNGISEVIVEVACDHVNGAALSEVLCSDEPLFEKVVVIPTASPIGPRALAVRAGLALDEPLLQLPSDTLVHCALPSPPHALRYQLSPTALAMRPRFELAIEPLAGPHEPTEMHDGWAARLESEEDALDLGCRVLDGGLAGVLVHAAEVQPGVWLARGARVSPDAQLRRPVYVGPRARVLANAQVGPRVVVGTDAVIERSAHLTDCVVEPQTLVGEETRARGVRMLAGGSVDLGSGAESKALDGMLLTRVHGLPHVPFASRLAALGLIVLLLVPWLLAAVLTLPFRRALRSHAFGRATLWDGSLGIGALDLLPRLLDVLRGRRNLLGPRDLTLFRELPPGARPAPGALDVMPLLLQAADQRHQLRFLAWYARNKRATLDWRLWAQRGR